MRGFVRTAAAAALMVAVSAGPTRAEELAGTLQKVKETKTFTIAHRDSSVPLSYLDDQQKPVGFSIDLCQHVVAAVKDRLKMPDLEIRYLPVTSSTRIPLIANGTADIECGSTANQLQRQKQVAFSVSFYIPEFKWIVRKDSGVTSVDDLKGKTVVVTQGTNTAQFVDKLNAEQNLNLKVLRGKDHAESFLYVGTKRALAFIEDDILLAGLKANASNPEDFVILDRGYPSDPYALMFRRDDPQFKALVDEVLVGLMKSGEFAKLYAKWFENPIPPKGINLRFPMSDKLKEQIKNPTDKANS